MSSALSLVLVHGLIATGASWRRNIPAFSQHFQVYAPDLPLLPVSDEAEWLVAWMDRQGIVRAHLLGVSAGGGAILQLAAKHPERVGDVILAAPVHPLWKQPRIRIALAASPVGELIFHAAQLLRRPLTRFILRYRLYADAGQVDAETVDLYAAPLGRAGLPGELRRFFANLDLPPLPAEWPHRTLLIWGDRDRQVPVESAQPLAAALDARLEIIPGGAHLVFEENPGEFNQRVLEFLSNGLARHP